MNLENLISEMMTMSVKARLWHWSTDVAQHHVTYEAFLTQNETSTDSLVESMLGNDTKLDFSKVGVQAAVVKEYSLENTQAILKEYRDTIFKSKQALEEVSRSSSNELITILDDVTELVSKTLYLLKLK